MNSCVFCAIGSGAVDADLAVRTSERVFVLPPVRQRPSNRGHVLVLPVTHVRNLHDAGPALLSELMTVVTTLTAAFPGLYGATGSFVFQNNVEPDAEPFHLHIHAVPRFSDDDFAVPDAASVTEVSRADRLAQAATLRAALGDARADRSRQLDSAGDRA